jgi:hypothetical protein
METPPPSDPEPPHGHSDSFRIRVAVLIAVVSIAGALVAWRASLASIHAAALDQDAEQQLVQQEQRRAALEGQVANDLQLYGRYQEHIKAWRLLSAQADRIRSHNPDLAITLGAQAQNELGLARTLRPFFQAGLPDFGDDNGTVVYDPQFVLRNLFTGDRELAVLDPDEVFEEADDAHGKTVDLVAIVALLIAAIFLLTLAQFVRSNNRRLLAGAGAVVALAGIVLFVLVELSL